MIDITKLITYMSKSSTTNYIENKMHMFENYLLKKY